MERKDTVSNHCMEQYLKKSQERKAFNLSLVQRAFELNNTECTFCAGDSEQNVRASISFGEVQALADVLKTDPAELVECMEK